ncbi:MAG: DUF4115 domain-containing protein, partial [Gammaproteobacteria bacterium]|nr:DUF4115 domain-containing protein [Gammaproteobacteria bacterium]
MNEDAATYESSQSLGERLRAARETKKLSQEELAALLHLQVNIIQALENNQFDQLAAPTYVKGYIRSMARHVDLDGDELIQQYESGTPSSKSSPEIVPQVSAHTQVTSTDKPVKIMTYLISLGLVLLLLIWWQSEFIVNTGSSRSSGDARGADGPYPGGFDYTYDIVIHPRDPFYRAPSTQDSDTGPADLVNEMPGHSDTLPLLDIDENINTASGQEAGQGSDPERPLTDAILILRVNKDSWIEVRDINNEKLYLDLAKPGEAINISGEKPLSVVLG